MISGLLLLRWTWPSIFWFLSASSFITLVVMLLLLPETGRNIVGNGTRSTYASKTLQILSTPLFGTLDAPKSGPSIVKEQRDNSGSEKSFNPFSAILMLKDRGTLIASICFGIYYMVHTCLQASLSTVFVDIYHVSGLVAGLIYIPFGVGCSIASFVAGVPSICISTPSHMTKRT